MLRGTAFRCLVFFTLSGCAQPPEARTAHEVTAASELVFTANVDASRIERGTGLAAVPALVRLLEDELAPFFRAAAKGAATNEHAEIIAEAPAPGYAVRAVVDARPDDFCVVTLAIVRLLDGNATQDVSLAPYSLHFGFTAVRRALVSLSSISRPALDDATFASLRKQASEARARGDDQPMDQSTFARTPLPLERSDQPPHYFAPVVDAPSTLQ